MEAETRSQRLDSPRSLNSPLDPYVDRLVRWVAERPDGVPAVGLAASVARDLDWPAPFAEAILASVRARRLLRIHRAGARALRLVPSPRAQRWLADRPFTNERGSNA